jgi:hypothetical protein
MSDENKMVMLRSAKSGSVRCPLKGEKCYGGIMDIFQCQQCKYNEGFYQLPLTTVVACSKQYWPSWGSQTCAVFYVSSLKHLKQFKIMEVK